MRAPRSLAAVLGAWLAMGCGGKDPAAVESRASQSLHEEALHEEALHEEALGDEALGDELEVYLVLAGPSVVASLPPDVVIGTPAAAKLTRARLAALEAEHAALRPRFEAEGLLVIGDLTRLANAFHLRGPRRAIERVGAFAEVDHLELVPLHERLLATAGPVVGAPQAWATPPGLHGEGIRLGIIDTGIDYLHADFGGSGLASDYNQNDRTVIEPGSFPTARVVGGWDFTGDTYDPQGGKPVPTPDPDPLDCDGHGTHVAGIAAGGGVTDSGAPYTGPYDLSFQPSAFRVAPGVAPLADIYILKVFGCSGGTTVLAEALERAVDPDEDGDLADRLDVVNASLGSAYGIASPLQESLVANFATAGGLLVVANGNDGASFFTTGSPASYPQVLAVGASRSSLWVTLEVSAPPAVAGDYPAVEGQFTTALASAGPLVADIVASVPQNGCTPFQNASAMAGQIALVDRGNCPFAQKLDNATAAGAVAAIVVNNEPGGDFFAMSAGPDDQSPIPGVMISNENGALLRDALQQGVAATLSSAPFAGVGADLVAGLSSRGPTAEGTLLKPEIAAPGVNILSAAVGQGSEAAPNSGTSMASPFVAGAAALVRQASPTASPTTVKALLMNGARPLANEEGDAYALSMQGAGRLAVDDAVTRVVIARADRQDGAIAIPFGAVVAADPWSRSADFIVENLGSEPVTLGLGAEQVLPLPGVVAEVSPTELTLGAGETATATLTLSVDPAELGSPGPDANTSTTQFDLPRHWIDEADGHVVLHDEAAASPSEGNLRLPFHAAVRAAGHRHAASVIGCGGEGSQVSVELVDDGPHPEPVTSVFELGAILERHPDSDDPATAMLDLRAMGAASDAASEEDPNEVSVFFGLAVEGTWSTPALGPYSLVGVHVDVTNDDFPDYAIVVEPLGAEAPHADVLAATTYRLTPACTIGSNFTNCTQTASKRYANILPPDVQRSYPYLNGVLVLSAYARDLGLDESLPSLRYRAFSQSLAGTFDTSPWVQFDYRAPRVDAGPGAPTPGRPIFGGPLLGDSGEAIAIDVREAGGQALLLHHTNVEGERYEVVSLDAASAIQPVTLSHDFPAEASPSDGPLVRRLQVDNPSDRVAHDLRLDVALSGAEPLLVAPDRGSCEVDEDAEPIAIRCELGDLPPGGSLAVSLHLAADGKQAELTAEVRSAAGCTEATAASIAFSETTTPVSPLDVSGGCGCRLGPKDEEPRSPKGPWLLSAWLVALLTRRGLVRRGAVRRRRAGGRARA
ncbi:MAG: S8 family serine peptidase [Polyangiaceae bacterium]